MRNIKRFLNYVFVAFLVTLFIGCGNSTKKPQPLEELTKQLKFKSVSFEFYETRTADNVVYHTRQELENILNESIKTQLSEKGLLSNDSSMNTLKIQVMYKRQYVGDATFLPSDALRYPEYSYEINIVDNNGKVLKSYASNLLTYSGGFKMNLEVIAATLRDKKHEIKFIDKLAEAIVESIEDL